MGNVTIDEFHLLFERNDWEYVTIEFGDGTVFKPNNGSTIEIMFPDGYIEKVKVEYRMRYGHWEDHGHHGSTTSNIPGFVLDYHGLQRWQSFAGLRVKR